MERTDFRFYREGLLWYIDLPEWEGPKENLQMILGADMLLDVLSNENPDVTVRFTNYKFDGCHSLVHLGGGYYENDAWHGPSIVWLCDVTEFIFGEYPDIIYYRRI